MGAPNPIWYVYSADRHLVATYSTQAAAAAHVASWPAAYYTNTAVPSPTGLEELDTGPSTSITSV